MVLLSKCNENPGDFAYSHLDIWEDEVRNTAVTWIQDRRMIVGQRAKSLYYVFT